MKKQAPLLLSATTLSIALLMVPGLMNQDNVVQAQTSNRIAKSSVPTSGTVGTCPWVLDSSGILHIKAGALSLSSNSESPWDAQRNLIKTIKFDSGVKGEGNLESLFYRLGNVASIDFGDFDTSNVTSMAFMFAGLGGLTSLDLSHFDTSNVTNMHNMFTGVNSLTSLDLSHFDTSNVTNMALMFAGVNSLTSLDLSHFDTSNVTDMHNMFFNANSLTSLDLSHFDTSKVTNMNNMLSGANVLASLELGSKTKLTPDVALSFSDPSGKYTGNWQVLGTGTSIFPTGKWVGTTDELITRSAQGVADTYVAQRKHDYSFTANDLTIKQSETTKLDIAKASKAKVEDKLYPDKKFTIIVKDKGGLTSKGGTYKVTLGAKEAPELSKTITVKVIPDSKKPIIPDKYQTMYRVYNKNTGEHLYTASAFERDSLIKGGWSNEGIGWTAPTKGTAVYRVYNPNAKGGDHYYTASNFEANSLVKTGWKWDNGGKPVFYSGGKTKIYVAYNPNAKSGSHNYTSSLYEQQSLLKTGWKYGKVQFYGQ